MAGRPKKERTKLVSVPDQFDPDPEFGLTKMQSAFVWHYTEGACAQTEAARRAGFEFPANAASKMLNGRDFPKVTKAIRFKQDELGHFDSSVAAIKELNQLAGLSINRSQNLNINANIDGMNKDDIKQRLGKLLGANSPELLDNDF